MASRKNKWRRRGALEFRRESGRYSDGGFTGDDRLFIRIKGKACAIVAPFASTHMPGKTVSVLLETYRIVSPCEAPRLVRDYLLRKAAAGLA